MIVIAEVEDDNVLVKLSKKELANICGFYSKYDFKIELNKKVNISDIYSKHYLIKNIQESADYNKARKKLKEMLEALTPIEEKINIIQLKD